jgi:hypothetical protein
MLKKSSDYRGRLLYGDDLAYFHTLGVGQKLGYIRGILDQEYPGEFTRAIVAKECGITYQGMLFLEEKSKRKPREATVKKLAEIYNIPGTLIEDNSNKLVRRFRVDPTPIFIGKPEDHTLYLKDAEEQNETNQSSLINFTPTGNDLLEVDLELTIYIPSTPVIHRRDRIAHRVKLTLDDIDTIHELVGKQIELIAGRRDAIIRLQKEDI